MTTCPREIRAAATALAFLAWVSSASAAPGDQRVIVGTLVWPHDISPDHPLSDERMAIVQGDLGVRYSAELTATTELPEPLRAGHRVALLVREGQHPDQFVVLRAERPTHEARATAAAGALRAASPAGAGASRAVTTPSGPASGQLTVEGTVLARSGGTVILRRADNQSVAIDISALDGPGREIFQSGRTVSVFGVVLNGVVLAAQGVNADYSAALRRAR